MGNETKMTMDKIVESADAVYSAAVDRVMDRVEQTEENIDKDKHVAKKAGEVIAEAAEVVIEAAAEHVVGLLNGEKIDFNKEKNRVIETIDKVVDKADAYYDMITNRVLEKLKQREQNVEKDIETGKQLMNELNSNS